ncbi:MAG: DUF59 domain-containing protein [Leptospiraceae bacterium]|nr:DUF59 domain-containing protein [Leptospiraceae bacterium]MDW8306455.1 DUF59 domain-containing protein [Leptospiraceae bacterium]
MDNLAKVNENNVDEAKEARQNIQEEVIEVLRTCYDPEIPLNIYDLGLIYNVDVSPEGFVRIDMTLTSPNCPSIESLPLEVEEKVRQIDGVTGVDVRLVWDPPFHIGMMSDEAKLALGLL